MTDKPKLEILAYEDTKLGLLCLRRRELIGRPGTIVTELTLNHELLMSSYVTLSERHLAKHALAMHEGVGLSVLVGGLGLGYTAHEIVRAGGARIQQVEVVELLPEVIGFVERDLIPLARAIQAEERIVVREGDIFARLAEPPTRRHDLILIDVDHSPDEVLGGASAELYTDAGLRKAKEHLADDGVLAVWSYAEHSRFSAALGSVFGSVRVEPVTVVNDLVDEEQTDWLFLARK